MIYLYADTSDRNILYTNTNKKKFGSFFPRALAYEVNGVPR